MRSDYGNLRRRTRDSSWQWLLMGTILGMGFALVMCVGGYALGAITFPLLDGSTATPVVRVEPNATEVAMQAIFAQQTLDAAEQVLATVSPEPTLEADSAAQPDRTSEGALEVTNAPTATPSPLPAGDTGAAETAPPGGEPSDTAATPTRTQPAVQALPVEGSPAVGTPPVGTATEVLGLPQGPSLPPELDALKTEMVTVTGGTFLMGTTAEEGIKALDECALYGKVCDDPSWVQDSTPPHQVTVDSFQMEIYEVSVTQYVAFLNWMGPNSHKFGCEGQPCALTTLEDANLSDIAFDGTEYAVRNPEYSANKPITLVTWWGAKAYCDTLDRRLPTEAEWERAARGPQNNIYPWGNEFDTQKAMSSVPEAVGTVPVSDYPNGTSPYGIFNLAGNVSEWVWDWYQPDYYTSQYNNPTPNPRGPVSGTTKVHRGGSWDTIPLFLRTVHRMDQAPGNPTASIGFRCVSDQTSVVPPTTTTSTEATGDTTANSAPTMAPPPTQVPLPSPTSSEPTATLSPG